MTGALAQDDATEPCPDLAAIQARAEAATPGPWTLEVEGPDYEAGAGSWHTGIYGPENVSFKDGTPEVRESFGHQVSEVSEMLQADADFVAHARQDIPDLLAALAVEKDRADTAQAELAERDEWENDVAGRVHPSWDGDEAQVSILTSFIRHAARLDSAIEDAREADGWSGAPLAFVWNDNDRTLSSVPAPPQGPTVLAATVRKIAATLTSPAQIHTLLYAADRIADQEAPA